MKGELPPRDETVRLPERDDKVQGKATAEADDQDATGVVGMVAQVTYMSAPDGVAHAYGDASLGIEVEGENTPDVFDAEDVADAVNP